MIVRNVFVLSTAIALGALVMGALALRYGLELFAVKEQAWEYHGRSRVILEQMVTTAWKLEEGGAERSPSERVQRMQRAVEQLDTLNTSAHAPDNPLSVSGVRRSLSALEDALTRFSSGNMSRLPSQARDELHPYLEDLRAVIDTLAERHSRAMTALESRYRNRVTEVVFNLTMAAILIAAIVLTLFVVVVSWIRRHTRDNREAFADLRRAQRELEALAYHDPLTELPNRRLFETHLRQIIAMASRSDLRFALLMLDVDDFKRVNDDLGHQEGDLLLRSVAQRLQASLRQVDLVARVGGDEFAVVLADVRDEPGVTVIIDKLVERVSQPLTLGEHRYRPRISMGVYLIGPEDREPEQVMRSVDLALYEAKEQGKRRYCFHTRELEIEAERKQAMEKRLRRALEQEALELHFQPQIHIASRRVVGFEALLRWRAGDGRLIYPNEFIPDLSDRALLDELLQWVIRSALARLSALHGHGFKDVDVALNLSSRQLHNPALPDVVQSLLREEGVESYRLKLEITEATLLERIDESRTLIESLRQLGVRVSIDDFGTGYSSLSYLKMLAVDEIKIDSSYTAHIAEDPEIRELVKAIISLAHGLKMLVVAEGVETREQFDILESLDCDVVQGFFCGAPVPYEKVVTADSANWMSPGPTRGA